MRGGLILFNNNVAGSYWDVEHFQHPYKTKKHSMVQLGVLSSRHLSLVVIADIYF